MINSLIRWSLDNRMAVIIVSFLFMGLGAWYSVDTPVDVFPDLTAPTVTVVVEGHGMAPEEMETLVTFPIETAVNGAAGVRRVRSATAVGISVVWVEFDWGTEIYRARQTVTERLATVSNNLPPQVGAPVLAPISSMMGEIVFASLSSDRHDPLELRTAATTNVRRRLLSVPGVSQVTPIGGDQKQYQVVLTPQRLRAYQVSVSEVAEALRDTNENVSAGFLVQGGQESLIKGFGRVQSPRDIGNTVVTLRDGRPVRVSDLGAVLVGPAIKRGTGSASWRDEQSRPVVRPAVILAIQKQPGANTLELTERLDDVLDQIATTLPPGMEINKELFRQATFISAAVENVAEALRDGGILVILIVVAFLASIRSSIITLLAIPLSIIVAIVTLRIFGGTINTMTLGGLAIAIGSLVDDAIIDVENIVRRLRENAALPPEKQRPILRVIYEASVEVRAAIVFATAIIVLVFTPIFFLSGVEGRLLRPLGVAFCVSLAASLVVALTLTPALSSYLLPRSRSVRSGSDPWLVRTLKRLYDPPLRGALRAPLVVIVPTVLLFVGTLFATTRLGQNFLPEFNEGALTVGVSSIPGTSLEQSDALARVAQELLLQHPEVQTVGRRTGRAEQDEHVMGPESSELEVTLDMDAPLEEGQPRRTKAELLAAIRADFESLPGVQAHLGQPISHRIDHMLSGTYSAIAVKIFGPDLYELRHIAKRIEHTMEGIPGVVDLAMDQQADTPLLRVEFDRDAIARFGLRVADVARALETAYRGDVVSQVLEGQNTFDLTVRIGEADRSAPAGGLSPWTWATPEMVGETLVDSPTGVKVPLKVLANIYTDRGPNFITREDAQRKIVVQCNVADRDVTSVVSDIQAAVAADVELPPGYHVEYGGQFETAAETSRLLTLLGVVVVLGIGFLLHLVFHSIRDTLLVMVNLPLALIGGVLGVFLSGGVLSVASMIGFIAVFGIAARNGIMMVSHIRHLQRHEGVTDFRAAVRRGALERLSPILMTALASGIALIPLALGVDKPGNEILRPMAFVILFGLLSSTFLNMAVVPALFLWFAKPVAPAEHETEDTYVAEGRGGTQTWRPGLAPALLFLPLMLLVGCASVNPEPDFQRARTLIERSTGYAAPDEAAGDLVPIDELLADGLTAEEAVEIALRNNRGLQAAFHEIGIARADWVQAGLLENPSLGIGLMFPEGGGRSSIQANLAQNIVDLWHMPVRRRAAERDVEQRIVSVAREAGLLVAETRRAYYRAVSAAALRDIAAESVALYQRSLEATRTRRETGVGTPLDENLQRGEWLQARLDLQNAESAAINARRKLLYLLSLECDGADIALSDALPTPDGDAYNPDALIKLAQAHRLDLAAVENAIAADKAQIQLEHLRIFPDVTIGLGAERLEGRALPGRNIGADFARASLRNGQPSIPDIQSRGERSAERNDDIEFMFGPNVSVTLPIFDQNQAQIAKARYTHAQAVLSYEDLLLSICRDIRIAAERTRLLASNVVFFETELLPQSRRNLELTEAARETGAVDVLTLLVAQQRLLETERQHVVAQAQAAGARIDLELAVGKPLSEVAESPVAAVSPDDLLVNQVEED